jgi:hypothetical protein
MFSAEIKNILSFYIVNVITLSCGYSVCLFNIGYKKFIVVLMHTKQAYGEVKV